MSELPDPDSFGDYADWPGREVHGPFGRLGTVVEIYLDDATDRPEWVLVEFDEGSRFVPLAGGSVEGDHIRVVHGTRVVTGAPDFELSKELTQEQERQLYDHYDVAVSEEASESLLPDPEQEPEPTPEPEPEPTPEPTPEPETTPEPEPEPTPAPPVAVTEPATEPPTATPPEPTEPIAALPPEGETSEPENEGPPVPPRPEPVAPPRPQPTTPPPPPPYSEATADEGKPPAAVIAGAAALAILLLIILRRRG